MNTQNTLTIKLFNRVSQQQDLISPETFSRCLHAPLNTRYPQERSSYPLNSWDNNTPKIAFSIFNTYYKPSQNNPQRVLPDDSPSKNRHEDLMTLCPHGIFIHLVFTIRILLHNSHPTAITNEGHFKRHDSIFPIINPDVNFTRTLRSV